MGKNISNLFLAVAVVLSFSHPCSGAEVNIDQFPKVVSTGQNANIVVTWNDFPVSKGYLLRVQLQDSEVSPPIFVFQDFDVTKPEGRLEVSLPIPLTVTASNSAKFVAAFLSKTSVWDDVLTTADSGTLVSVVSDFKFTIDEYPTFVVRGETVNLKVSWKGVKLGKGYKLILQLENWQIKPGFAYVVTVADFGAEGEKTISIKIPDSAPEASKCRFVAAFISREKNWNDLFAMTTTPYDVEIVKHKPI